MKEDEFENLIFSMSDKQFYCFFNLVLQDLEEVLSSQYEPYPASPADAAREDFDMLGR